MIEMYFSLMLSSDLSFTDPSPPIPSEGLNKHNLMNMQPAVGKWELCNPINKYHFWKSRLIVACF